MIKFFCKKCDVPMWKGLDTEKFKHSALEEMRAALLCSDCAMAEASDNFDAPPLRADAPGLPAYDETDESNVDEIETYETIGGEWWLFQNGKEIRPLTDREVAQVVFGEAQAEQAALL